MWYYICLMLGAVIGWSMCAICTVAKCDDCRTMRTDLGVVTKSKEVQLVLKD